MNSQNKQPYRTRVYLYQYLNNTNHTVNTIQVIISNMEEIITSTEI